MNVAASAAGSKPPLGPTSKPWQCIEYHWASCCSLSLCRDTNICMPFTAMRGKLLFQFQYQYGIIGSAVRLHECAHALLFHHHFIYSLMFITLSLTLSAFSSSYPCHAHHKHAGKKCSTLPLRLLLPKTDALYKIICMHCYSGSMLYLQAILSIQVVLAIMLIFGYRTRLASIGSWVLYLSLTLRNTWLNFILDRCVEYLFGWC